jgi:hypothetical protein
MGIDFGRAAWSAEVCLQDSAMEASLSWFVFLIDQSADFDC